MDAAALYEQLRAHISEQRAEDAEALAREMARRWPESDQLRLRLAEALFMQGRWLEAWPLYERRRGRLRLCEQNLPFPEWGGEPLDGRSILVWGEQGMGDEIQMARFVPRLRERGAGPITLACHAPLVRALRQTGAETVISHSGERVQISMHEAWVALGSLPHRFQVTPQTLSGAPYLSAPPAPGGGIGLVERGNPLHPNDANRSLPLGALAAAAPQGRILEPSGDGLDSLAQLAGLDLLVTVDTSWAHMAGALGVPVWLLLPFHGLDWRWMRRRADTPWYASMRLFRQTTPGDWEPVLAEVQAALAAR